MVNIIGKAVSNVRLHTVYHVEGLGQIPAVLNTTGSGAWLGLEMTKTETGVLCCAPGKTDNRPRYFFFPDTNCIGMTLSM